MRILFFLMVACFLSHAAQSSETYYKWQDAQGTWHYTTTPPPADARGVPVSIQPGEASATPAAEQPAPQGKTATPAEQAAAAEKRRVEYCATARKNAETLEKNSVVTTDASGSGNEKPLTPEQHAREMEKARAMVTLYCTPATP